MLTGWKSVSGAADSYGRAALNLFLSLIVVSLLTDLPIEYIVKDTSAVVDVAADALGCTSDNSWLAFHMTLEQNLPGYVVQREILLRSDVSK